MEKYNPLPPYAFTGSSFTENEKVNTNSATDDRKPNHHQVRPTLGFIPSLKRKMGESFNEKDNIKKRGVALLSDSDDVQGFVELPSSYTSEEDATRPNLTFPSSPPLESQLMSEYDETTRDFEVPESVSLWSNDNELGVDETQKTSKKEFILSQATNLSSEADFGIDRFNRFKNPSFNDDIPTDRSFEHFDQYDFHSKQSHSRAKDVILEAFENIKTNINLEGMELRDLPDEIKDMDKLVIFDSDPTSQISYQLYLTNNKLTYLPPSLFKFTKLNVLGLRQNRLTRIPPIIKKLTHLTDLYLGTNRLEFLPPQILDLPRLDTFRAGPNKYIKVYDNAIPYDRIMHPDRQLKFVSEVVWHTLTRKTIMSLKLICLNTVAKYDVSYLDTKSWKKFTPKLYHGLIVKAIFKGRYEETCSECDKIVVEPIAHVLEWWDFLQNKEIPIKREFCSGKCVQRWSRRTLMQDNE